MKQRLMKQFLLFPCTTCKKQTNHDVLSKTEDGANSKLRISCRHCEAKPFEITYPKEIVEANLQNAQNGNYHLTNNLDVGVPSQN